jgi:hypothetical protein
MVIGYHPDMDLDLLVLSPSLSNGSNPTNENILNALGVANIGIQFLALRPVFVHHMDSDLTLPSETPVSTTVCCDMM